MNKSVYVAIDTETGGLTDECSLLTMHAAILDKDLNILNELELIMKPDDCQYVVTAQGLSINKINLIEHDKMALSYSHASQRLKDFLSICSMHGDTKLIPLGKNVAFDLKKIYKFLIKAEDISKYLSNKTYDVEHVIRFLKRTNKLRSNIPESLEGLANYFGIRFDKHTAKGDNIATIEIIKNLESL